MCVVSVGGCSSELTPRLPGEPAEELRGDCTQAGDRHRDKRLSAWGLCAAFGNPET